MYTCNEILNVSTSAQGIIDNRRKSYMEQRDFLTNLELSVAKAANNCYVISCRASVATWLK